MQNCSETVIEGSKDGYPELEEKKRFHLSRFLANEEDKFNKTIDQGLRILARHGRGYEAGRREDTVRCRMHSSCMILTDSRLILQKRSWKKRDTGIDEDGFKACYGRAAEQEHVTAREVTNYMGADATVYDQIDAAVTY